jgi:hypothetical protein
VQVQGVAAAPRFSFQLWEQLIELDMRPEGPARHFILAFLLALAGYIVFYQGIEHRRTRNGPWRVTFTSGSNNVPTIVIDQPRLAITNVQISFTGETVLATNGPATLVFGQPRPVPYAVPFGQCVFMDTTFLPGTVTLRLFGHEIELLPRVLVVDRQEHPWRPGTSVTLVRGQTAPAASEPRR